MSAINRTSLVLFVCASVMAQTAGTAAQPTSQAPADALFAKGRALMDASNYAEAANTLVAADQIAPGVGIRMNLGHCYKAIGKTASAWRAFNSAAELANQRNDQPRYKRAIKEAQALKPEVPFVVLTVAAPDHASELQVTLAGQQLVARAFGTSIPVDPGYHVIRASALGCESWEGRIVASATRTIHVQVPALVCPSVAAPPSNLPVEEPLGEPVSESETSLLTSTVKSIAEPTGPLELADTVPRRGRTLRVAGVVTITAGAAAIGLGLKFGLDARHFSHGVSDLAPGDTYDPALDANGRSAETKSLVLFGAGAGAVVGGTVLYVLGSRRGRVRQASVTWMPTVAPSHVGLAIEGRF